MVRLASLWPIHAAITANGTPCKCISVAQVCLAAEHMGRGVADLSAADRRESPWKKNEVRRHDPDREPEDITFDVFRYRHVIPVLPLHEFLEEWSPKSPRPRPTQLSRHVSIHHAGIDHYSRCNAVLALMLITGMIAAFSEALFRSSDEGST